MTERVPADEIENIVGRKRSVKDHYARAVSAEQTVYILHSRECLAVHADLRECPWSLALDRGIDLSEWVEDVPLTVRVRDGRLVPSPAQVRFFRRREPPPRGSSGLGASATRDRSCGFPNDKGLNT